jgi:hypothetical protein
LTNSQFNILIGLILFFAIYFYFKINSIARRQSNENWVTGYVIGTMYINLFERYDFKRPVSLYDAEFSRGLLHSENDIKKKDDRLDFAFSELKKDSSFLDNLSKQPIFNSNAIKQSTVVKHETNTVYHVTNKCIEISVIFETYGVLIVNGRPTSIEPVHSKGLIKLSYGDTYELKGKIKAFYLDVISVNTDIDVTSSSKQA